jgi:tRNA (adenine37-N6)-methyltransferase
MGEQPKIEIVGVIETPFREPAGCPIQPSRAAGAVGTVRVDPRFQAGLRDIEGFDRIWLIYWLHQAPEPIMLVTPFLDREERGIFATRAPARPSAIGLSAVRLLGVEGNLLHVADVDMVSGTPLLDIKPYVPEFDCHPGSRAGWFDRSGSGRCLADDRFQSRRPAEDPGDR